jgi:hypothetical protein
VPGVLGRADGSDPFDDGKLWLSITFGGAGRLEADLSPSCAAALRAVLDSLGKKAGPEDTRTVPQRQHDALYDALRRLIAARNLPDRAGQPVQLQLHITLDELLRRYRAQQPASTRGNPASQPRWPTAAGGEECDAAITPIVTGALDHDLLNRLVNAVSQPLHDPISGYSPGPARPDLATIRDLITANAAALLSGPRGLASWLRRSQLPGPAGTVSLPLDTGKPTETIPAHLRRAVIHRDQHCAAPGCTQPPPACQIHHITPISQGGHTKLTNLLLLCTFHHLTMIHKWGWTITLRPAGTTIMTSPNRDRTYRSHAPPTAA